MRSSHLLLSLLPCCRPLLLRRQHVLSTLLLSHHLLLLSYNSRLILYCQGEGRPTRRAEVVTTQTSLPASSEPVKRRMWWC